jgi:hypothetical protein
VRSSQKRVSGVVQGVGTEFKPQYHKRKKYKWIKDLNIRPETLKLIQERTGNTME